MNYSVQVHIAQTLYGMGFHVLFSDADVSWMHDPLPYLMPVRSDTKWMSRCC